LQVSEAAAAIAGNRNGLKRDHFEVDDGRLDRALPKDCCLAQAGRLARWRGREVKKMGHKSTEISVKATPFEGFSCYFEDEIEELVALNSLDLAA